MKKTRDYPEKFYEIQLKYGDDWKTVERPNAFIADQAWHKFIKRYRTYQARMVVDGKVIRKRA